ncbi:MAG: hypothetical protein L0216_04995 [Planctomycetales bacterium]|nr:hypothetical protein [Planctomycetales bacterium]
MRLLRPLLPWLPMLMGAVAAAAPCAAQDPSPPPAPQEPPPAAPLAPESRPPAPEPPAQEPAPAPEAAPAESEKPEKKARAEGPEEPPLPFLVEPRALAYLRVLPTLRLDRDGVEGTEIDVDRDLGLDNYEIASPAVNFELRSDVGGVRNIIRFAFRSSEYRGAHQLSKEITYDKTTYLVGTPLETILNVRYAEARVDQRLWAARAIEAWVNIGILYAFFGTELKAVGGQVDSGGVRFPGREVDSQEAFLPMVGARVEWAVADWFSLFAEGDGMSLGTGPERSTFARAAGGFEMRFGKGWGLTLDYAVSWLQIVKGRDDRDETSLLVFGPRLALIAEL